MKKVTLSRPRLARRRRCHRGCGPRGEAGAATRTTTTARSPSATSATSGPPRGRARRPAAHRQQGARRLPAVLARRQVDRLLQRPRGEPRRLPDPGRRRRGQATHDPLGRRHRAGLDARRQGRSSSPASAARTSWASSTPSPSTAACPRTPAPTWASPAATRPTARKLAINRKAQVLLAQVLPRRLPERRDGHGPGRPRPSRT